MKIPSINLEAFYTLSQEKNFTRAAKVIGLSQPAFSQRIQSLESFLETTLIIREKGNIRLTENGIKLLQYCKINLNLENTLLNDLTPHKGHELTGEIRIAGFSSIMRSVVLPAMTAIIKNHSKTKLNLITAELSELPALLKSSKVDFILLNQAIDNEHYTSEPIGEEILVEIMGRKDMDIYLDHDEFDKTTLNFLKKFKLKPPRSRRYLGDIYAIYDGVIAGLGNAIMSEHLINTKRISIINSHRKMSSPIYLVYNKSNYYTKIQQEVISALRASFIELNN